MKNTLFTFVLILLFNVTAFSQKDYKARLLEYGRFSHAAISPSENFIIGISEGNIYKTDSFDGLWHPFSIDNVPVQKYNFGNFSSINFLSDRIIIAFASENNTYYLYKSTDKGLSWEKINIGNFYRIDEIYIGNNKEIWMSTFPLALYYSNDYGDTWQTIELPLFGENPRISSISNSPDNSYLFLSVDGDSIYKTKDMLHTWESIASPITKKTKNDHVYPVSKFNQLGDFYLVRQDKKVYCRKINVKGWRQIPNASDFIICGKSEAYLLNEDLSISIINSSMNLEWTSKEKLESLSDLYVQNGNLYAFTYEYIYKINRNDFLKNRLFTNDWKIKPSYPEIKWNGNLICFDNHDVLMFDNTSHQWYRYMELPIDFSDASVYENKIILTDSEIENHYQFDLENKSYKSYTLPKYLVDVDKVKIKSFRIEKGSRGCFHYNLKYNDYKDEGKYFTVMPFVNDTNYIESTSLGLKNNKEYDLIDSLLKEINETSFKYLSFDDLGIKQSDINAYRAYLKELYEEFKKKNVDSDDELIPPPKMSMDGNIEDYLSFLAKMDDTAYHEYETLLNSIQTVPDSIITKIFSEDTRWVSTTTNWVKCSIVFDDSTAISVYNEDYYPNYLRTPWIVEYKGLMFKTNSVKIGRLLNKIGDDKLLPQALFDKKYAIHQIITYLYNEKKDTGNLDDANQFSFKNYLWLSVFLVLGIIVVIVLFQKNRG